MAGTWRSIYAGSFGECVDAFVEEFAQRKQADPWGPLVALVGSAFLRDEILRRLHRRTGGALGVWLLTFRALAERLAGPALAANGKTQVDSFYQRALVARLLREQGGKHFAGVSGYDGTPAAFLRAFADLEEAGWTTWPNDASRAGKLGEVADLFAAYRAELTRFYHTPQDEVVAAIERAGDFARVFGAQALSVVGIYDANPQQIALLKALAGHIEVGLFIPRVPDPPPLAISAGAQAPEPFVSEKEKTKIWSCPSEEMEARAIVREALRLRRGEKPIPYHRMGVVLRQSETYAELLVDACRRAGVPCRLAGGCPPVEAGSIRPLRMLLNLPASPMNRGEVMALLSAVELPAGFQAGQADPASQTRWDAVSREARVRAGEDWNKRLADYAGKEKVSAEDQTAARSLQAVVAELSRGLQAMEQAPSYAAAAAACKRLSQWLIAEDHWLSTFGEGLERLRLLDEAGLEFDLPRFQARVRELLAGLKEEVEEQGGLQIVDVFGARGLRFEAVFLPGCVESAFPQPPRQDPILLDRERKEIAQAAGRPGALPVRSDFAREELRLFDIACQSATDRLYLSYPRMDIAQGRPRLPSHLLLELASRIVGTALTYERLPQQSPLVEVLPAGSFWPDDPAAGIDDDERDLALIERLAQVQKIAPVHYLLQNEHRDFARVWKKWVHQWAEWDLGAYDGLCASDAARNALRQALAERHGWSVTEIENYAQCPRRYMLERLLNLREPDDPEQTLSLPHDKRGLLLHRVLEKTLGAGVKPVDVEQSVRKLYAEYARENLTGGGVLDEVEVERIVQWAREMAEFSAAQSEGFEVEATEQWLGRDGVPVDLGEGRQANLRGRLDRVDINNAGEKRIVDYKSGKSKNSFTGQKLYDDSFNQGSTLQLPLYLLAYGAAHPEAAAEAVGAAYWFLKRADGQAVPKAISFSNGFAQEKDDILRSVLRDIITGVEHGRFMPRPDVAGTKNEYCEHCPFKALCEPQSRARMSHKDREAKLHPWLSPLGRIDGEDEK